MLIDSHCHLNLMSQEDYDVDTAGLVERALEAGVSRMLCVGTNHETSMLAISIANEFEDVFASTGIHPSEQLEKEPKVFDIVTWADHVRVVAIGETGLDYFYNDSGLDEMRQRFRTHIQAAKKVKKPLIIHTRNARDDTIKIMQEENASEVGGVMHCFTESIEMALQAMEMGFYISFSGIVTFKNAKELQAVVKEVPLDNMLIETDSPYLTPNPYRGKRNVPEYVRYVAEKIAELKNITYGEVVETTGNNFFKCFNTAV